MLLSKYLLALVWKDWGSGLSSLNLLLMISSLSLVPFKYTGKHILSVRTWMCVVMHGLYLGVYDNVLPRYFVVCDTTTLW